VEGSVRREGSNLRVTAQLINTSDGYHIWSASYDRQVAGLLGVEEEIAQTIATSLRAQHVDSATPHASPPDSQAYQRYMTGVYWRTIPTVARLRKAAGEFSAAVAADSSYASAQAALAEADARLYLTETVSPEESIVPSRAAAAKALELDDKLPQAHESVALIHLIDWDFHAAESEYQRALQLDPNNVRVRYAYAQLCLNPQRRYEEATVQLRRAIELDPVLRNLITELGATYRMMGKFDLAREQFHKSLALEPTSLGTRTNLAATDAAAGRYSEAAQALQAINADGPGDPWILGHLGYAYAKAGRTAEARSTLAALKSISTGGMHIAAIHAGLGEYESALDWLERGVAARSTSMFWVKSDFRFAGLHSNQRYLKLAAQLP